MSQTPVSPGPRRGRGFSGRQPSWSPACRRQILSLHSHVSRCRQGNLSHTCPSYAGVCPYVHIPSTVSLEDPGQCATWHCQSRGVTPHLARRGRTGPRGHTAPHTAGPRGEQDTLAIMTTILQATLRPRALASVRTQSSNCPLTNTAAALGLSHSVRGWAPPRATSSSPTPTPRLSPSGSKSQKQKTLHMSLSTHPTINSPGASSGDGRQGRRGSASAWPGGT